MFLFNESKEPKAKKLKKKEKVVSKVKKGANKSKNKASLMKGGAGIKLDFTKPTSDVGALNTFNQNVYILEYLMNGEKHTSLNVLDLVNIGENSLTDVIDYYEKNKNKPSRHFNIRAKIATLYEFLDTETIIEDILKQNVIDAANKPLKIPNDLELKNIITTAVDNTVSLENFNNLNITAEQRLAIAAGTTAKVIGTSDKSEEAPDNTTNYIDATFTEEMLRTIINVAVVQVNVELNKIDETDKELSKDETTNLLTIWTYLTKVYYVYIYLYNLAKDAAPPAVAIAPA